MKREQIEMLLELAGFAAIVTGLVLVAAWLGVLAGGVLLVAAANLPKPAGRKRAR